MTKKIFFIFSIFLTYLNIQTSLELFCGSMCSGKSRELINLVDVLLRGKKFVFVCKPNLDDRDLSENKTRDPRTYIPSRNGTTIDCTPIHTAQELSEIVDAKNADYIAIDEAQFLSDDYVPVITALIRAGKHVILAGLDTDFRGEPFGCMPNFTCVADAVHKLKAVCSKCHEYKYCLTQRLIDGKPAKYHDPIIMVGDQQYQPRCRTCHECPKE